MSDASALQLHEQLLLIGLDDDKGNALVDWGALDTGLAGAVLVALVDGGQLAPEDDETLVVTDAAPPGDAVLAQAHEVVAKHDRAKADERLKKVQKGLDPIRERAAERLVELGALDERRRSVLGMHWDTRLPTADPTLEKALRDQLADVLVTGRQPSPQEAQLVSLLHGVGLVKQAVPKADRDVAVKRAKEIAEGSAEVPEAVRKSVRNVQMMIAVAFHLPSFSPTPNVGN